MHGIGPATMPAARIGPVIAYEVIAAFCLEAGFLGITLFGWDKVGDREGLSADLRLAACRRVELAMVLG